MKECPECPWGAGAERDPRERLMSTAKGVADVIRVMRALMEDPSIVRFIDVPDFNRVCFVLRLPYRLARVEGEDENP